ncbi:MAG: acyl-CoA ligase (AMP-forming), exosortase A system-associated [Kiloniellaceae bacterium]
MSELFHHLTADAARNWPERPALTFRRESLTYAALQRRVTAAAGGLAGLGLGRAARVAVYLEKRLETVVALFAAAMAGGAFVPVNPLLRARQVGYILRDCGVRVLVTSPERARDLADELRACPELTHLVLASGTAVDLGPGAPGVVSWDELVAKGESAGSNPPRVIDTDMAAILYTSGSTGSPKGVVLSHRNLVAGAKSVSQYLENDREDRILSVLPLSFDAGLSQLTTGFNVGAEVVLMNYLLPKDVVRLCAEARITGLTCVPPLWIQLAEQDWPAEAAACLRYFANTGGHMPKPVLDRLRAIFPNAKPYLMYGLTEAFRSTYLDPEEVDRRPNSIGKAIPNAEILVVREDGASCAPGEPGELVHRGALVAMGYWNDPERTAERFRPAPLRHGGLPLPEIAVWSGDVVYTDEEGFIYFVGRRDEMIKSSGYRISPTEIEDVVYETGLVKEAVALGAPHPVLGQGIVVVAAPVDGRALDAEALMEACRRQLPRYMVPEVVAERDALPRGPNGKIDRSLLGREFSQTFTKAPHEQ